METLGNTDWDVVIAGTGLQESLLALALSRSGKRVLHIDKNGYYGGVDASFSLQEAQDWAGREEPQAPFTAKSIQLPTAPGDTGTSSKLSFSRAYSLALAPQIIYSRSALLAALVSSKVDAQLEFLAVGSWWVYSSETETAHGDSEPTSGTLARVPSGREDIFADASLEPRAKRALMRFLRFINDYENQSELWIDYKESPLAVFLLGKFALPPSVQRTLLALTQIPSSPSQISTTVALPRIARHLRSFGVFGPGFGAVIPKWGGLSEIAQIGCRAGAVGGGTYVLANGLDQVIKATHTEDEAVTDALKLKLSDGTTVSTQHLIASYDNTPNGHGNSRMEQTPEEVACRSISIVSSSLQFLFPPLAEGGPIPAAAIAVFPSTIVASEDGKQDTPQVYISIHSSDTGECPAGQSILYASVNIAAPAGFAMLDQAVKSLLRSLGEPSSPHVLWKLQFVQQGSSGTQLQALDTSQGSTILFPSPPLDLAFDDTILERVKSAWRKVMGDQADPNDFLRFSAREDFEAETGADED